MFDNFEVIANLHLYRFSAAADGINRVLAAAQEGPHMRAHAKLASVEIREALHATQSVWTESFPRLSALTGSLEAIA